MAASRRGLLAGQSTPIKAKGSENASDSFAMGRVIESFTETEQRIGDVLRELRRIQASNRPGANQLVGVNTAVADECRKGVEAGGELGC